MSGLATAHFASILVCCWHKQLRQTTGVLDILFQISTAKLDHLKWQYNAVMTATAQCKFSHCDQAQPAPGLLAGH